MSLADNVFMKVGDSISDSQHYLGCFKGDINNRAPTHEFNIIFGGHEDLGRSGLPLSLREDRHDFAFDRQSTMTRVGAAVTFPFEGDPPLALRAGIRGD